MRTRTIRAWSWTHKWSSLVSTLFLLMLCVTGLPLVFSHELNEALLHKPWAPKNPDGRLLTLDEVLAAGLAKHPGEVPAFMSFDEDRPVVNVTSRAPDAPAGKYSFEPIDQTRGEGAPLVAGHPVMEFLLQLHTDMFLGLPGMLFLGAMGLLLVVAVVSGVVLYAPFMRRLPFGTVRVKKAARTRWLDYHNLLGVVTAAWVLVVGLTGVINTLADPLTAQWQNGELAAMTARYRGAAPLAPAEYGSLDAAMDAAQRALPGRAPQFIAFPGGSYSTAHHYALFFQGDRPLTQFLLTPALVDARNAVLTDTREMPALNQALMLSKPLHFGDYGGLPLKQLWAMGGAASEAAAASTAGSRR